MIDIRFPARILAVCILLAASAPSMASGNVVWKNTKSLENHEICADAIRRVEQGRTLPRALMTAISRVESGRWSKERKALSAWPWTVTNGSDGQYFPTKAAAIAHVRKLKARGITNIDVGCMQINLRYHPDAFASLDEALDPVANATYSATLLGRLFEANRSWGEAIKRYHSAKAKFNRPYHEKVVKQWNIAKSEVTQEPVQRFAQRVPLRRLAPPKPPSQAEDQARRRAAAAHRAEIIAEHRAERARLRAERAKQMAATKATTVR